jgi:hypothetical protein
LTKLNSCLDQPLRAPRSSVSMDPSRVSTMCMGSHMTVSTCGLLPETR